MNDPFGRLRRLGPTLALAALAGAAGVAGSYVAAGFTPSFVVAPLDSYLAANTPAAVVTFAITVLGDLGQRLALGTAVVLATAAYGSLALFGLAAGREVATHLDRPVAGTLAGGLVGWAGVSTLTVVLAPAVGPAVAAGGATAAALVVGEFGRLSPEGRDSPGRRAVLSGLAGALGAGALGSLLGSGRGADPRRTRRDAARGSTAGGGESGSPGSEPNPEAESGDPGTEATTDESATVERLLGAARERSLDVSGLEPLVSERFYTVDINSVDPAVSVDDWRLRVTGAVEEPLALDYDALVGRESREEFVTLRCVGDPLNGKKMDNALWTVVDVEPLLEEAGVTADADACCVMLRAADDYFEEFPLAALREGMLAYRMNGAPLPRSHGAPVRALIPGHWGEINVKWLTEIEVLEREMEGYWERRGWHGTGPVTPVAKLHATNHLDDGRVEVAGHAYAGTRGVSRVEVSTDGGRSWNEAALSEPLPGEPRDAWRQWAHRYDPPGERHRVVVRAYDGEGEVQPRGESSPYPRGASGWVRKTVRP